MKSLALQSLAPEKGSRSKRLRVGRGGKRGTYSGKGQKGQKARSGVSGLKLKGMRRLIKSTPKLGGFQSIRTKPYGVNIAALQRFFTPQETVSIRSLRAKGILGSSVTRYKVLGSGKLTKKLIVRASAFSASAKKAIEAAGGSAIVA